MQHTTRLIAFAAVLCSFSFPAACIEPDIKPGDILENRLIAGHGNLRISLPEGNWEVAVTDKKTSEKRGNKSGVTYFEAFLFKAHQNRLTHLIYLSTSLTSGHGRGFVVLNNCRVSTMHFLESHSMAADGHQGCRWVNHSRIKYTDSHYEMKNEFGRYLTKKGLTYPNHFIDAGYRLADKFHALTLVYHFSPESEGLPNLPQTKWKDSPWHRDRFRGDPARVAFVDKIKAWSSQWYPKVKAGFVPDYK